MLPLGLSWTCGHGTIVTIALQTLHWLPVRQRITPCTLMHGVAFATLLLIY